MRRKGDTRHNRIFGRLRWQLARSFVLATLAVTMALTTVAYVAVVFLFFRSALFPQYMADQARRIAARLEPVVAPESRQDLRREVDLLRAGLREERARRLDGFEFSIRPEWGHESGVAVTDPAGRLLAGDADVVPRYLPRDQQAVLEAALRGETDVERLAVRAADGRFMAAAPLFSGEGRVVGALVVRIYVPFHARRAAEAILPFFLPWLGAALGVSLLAGGLAGWLAARGVARRLQGIAAAAERWGSGDLAARAPVGAPDELGQFARRLNDIATELRGTVALRQRLAVLEERRRLARDLHDTVKQETFALSMQLTALRGLLDSERARSDAVGTLAAGSAAVVRLEEMAARLQREMTALLRELRLSDTAEDAGSASLPPLVESLADLAEAVSALYGGPHASVDASGELPRLLPAVRSELLRIVREALINAARHSAASQIQVKTGRDGGAVWIRVADDGRGVPDLETATARGMGLRGMSERAAQLPGGSVEVETGADGGTRVLIRFVPVADPGVED